MLVALLLAGACEPERDQGAPPLAFATPPGVLAPSGTPFLSALLPTTTRTPEPSPTADAYAGLTIEDLAGRSYGGGELVVDETLQIAFAFKRVFFHYPSDGLTIYGFMDVPSGEGLFPVILVLHGYVNPANYQTLTYTTRYADALARAGYLVLHPNYRGHAPSDSGPNLFRVGYAIDVLNLIAIVQQTGGAPGPLHAADPSAIGLFGHSMGGGIALRVITVSGDVDAAVLYGAMSGDERLNFEKIREWSNGASGQGELDATEDDLERISLSDHLERIRAAVSIHHGQMDGVVPPAWSLELCHDLAALGKSVECFHYPGQAHIFHGDGEALFMERVLAFFEAHLKGP